MNLQRTLLSIVLLGMSAIAAHAENVYATSAVVNIGAGDKSVGATLAVVPAGQRLIVDSVSFVVSPNAPGGWVYALVEVTTNGKLVSFYVPMNKLVDMYTNTETWIGTFTGSLYADPGTSISVFGYRTALGVGSSFEYALSGHYTAQ